MATCLENINMPTCIWFETGCYRNGCVSMLAGILFFTGWWVIIDAASICGNISPGYYMCGVIVDRGYYDGGCLGPRGIKVWLFVGFVMGFMSLIASCGILFNRFPKGCTWSGVAVVIQNALILVSSVIYRFGRSDDHL